MAHYEIGYGRPPLHSQFKKGVCANPSGRPGFRWQGSDEGDQVEGEGSAELLDGGTIEIEFAYHNGEEAILKAKRMTSSTAC